MLNNFILVGRLTNTTTPHNTTQTTITLAVNRAYKNENGEYETDFIDVILYSNIAVNTTEYCNKGDIIGVKGRIQTRIIENEKKKVTELIADKVTFLSTTHHNPTNQPQTPTNPLEEGEI